MSVRFHVCVQLVDVSYDRPLKQKPRAVYSVGGVPQINCPSCGKRIRGFTLKTPPVPKKPFEPKPISVPTDYERYLAREHEKAVDALANQLPKRPDHVQRYL